MSECITCIGLDVHKETIAVVLAGGRGRGVVRGYGQIANTPAALTRLSSKLSQTGSVLRFCYEAGQCDYGIQRQLAARGALCGGGSFTDPTSAYVRQTQAAGFASGYGPKPAPHGFWSNHSGPLAGSRSGSRCRDNSAFRAAPSRIA